MKLTNEDLPVLHGGCHLIGTSHLRVRHAAHDEDEEARTTLVARLTTVLVPLAIACTETHTQWTHNGQRQWRQRRVNCDKFKTNID